MYILTLAIGVDYRQSLKKALESKRLYSEKHGYTYIEGGEEFWDRHRPIAWSKVGFLLTYLNKIPDGTLVWLSDADVLITNPNLKIEDHVLPLLPIHKDLLFIYDACHHLNSGNLLMRNSKWLRDFWSRVNKRTDCTYHIWWENMAMIKELEESKDDYKMIQITNEHKRFNAYLMGLEGEPLWEPNDFLVHFAGIYKAEKMEHLIEEILAGKVPRLSL
jgi:SepF-like predicted cell division protein (DUF552 family)